tara:strand:- start:1845 stop:1988 length:144 start_codon:yes stop_codon:yes gene_type:complete
MSLSAQNTVKDNGVLHKSDSEHSVFEEDGLIGIEFTHKKFGLGEYEN